MSSNRIKEVIGETVKILPGQYSAEQLRAIATKSSGSWVATAFIETDNTRIVVGVAHGPKRNKVIREAIAKGLQVIESGDSGDKP